MMMRRPRRFLRSNKVNENNNNKVHHQFLLLLCLVLISLRMISISSSSSRNAISSSSVLALSSSLARQPKKRIIAVIGGGASGIFAAIAAAEHSLQQQQQQQQQHHQQHPVQVIVLEGSKQTLKKVKISGGGRCNVMHDTSRFLTTRDMLTTGYPRGYKELNGIFSETSLNSNNNNKRKNSSTSFSSSSATSSSSFSSSFSPNQARAWFEKQPGVGILKTEQDGRMFPNTDSSQTIIDALLQAAAATKCVHIYKNHVVQDIIPLEAAGVVGSSNDDESSESSQSPPSPRFRIQIKEKKSNDSSDNDNHDSGSGGSTRTFLDTKNEKSSSYYLDADAVILATGSAPLGYQMASRLGHAIVPPVPSLFTLQTKHAISPTDNGLLHGLAGLSVPMARVSFVPAAAAPEKEQDADDDDTAASVPAGASSTTSAAGQGSNTSIKKKKSSPRRKNNKLQQEGPLLITHRGLSGPAILRLSAFGALDFYNAKYHGELRIHWAPLALASCGTVEEVAQELWKQITLRPKKTILSGCPLLIETTDTTSSSSSMSTTTAIPRRLWAALALAAGCQEDQVWASCSKKLIRKLAMFIADCRIQVTGKDVFKEEFVTAGGIDLKQVDMRTMQSKLCPGLYFCGEVLNVDGVTGGFNFLNCWSTGHVAGVHAASASSSSSFSSSSSTLKAPQ